MEEWDSRCRITKEVGLPKLQKLSIEEFTDPFVSGGIFEDYELAWLHNGPNLNIVSVDTGSLESKFDFSKITHDENTTIINAIELPISDFRNRMKRVDDEPCLAVAYVSQRNLSQRSYISFCHPRTSRILHTVYFREQITYLSIIIPKRDHDCPLGGTIKSMTGAIAVGTLSSDVIILDIKACDISDQLFNWGQEANFNDTSEDIFGSMSSALILDVRRCSGNEVKEKILASSDNNYHVGVLLSNFDKKEKYGKIARGVTAICYIAECALLAVGLDNGSFQFWDLNSLIRMYASAETRRPTAVTRFAFHEPCDDPEKLSYVWVVYEARDMDSACLPYACMYAAFFEKVLSSPKYGRYYKGFQHCRKRFELDLDLSKGLNGRCISCQVVTNTSSNMLRHITIDDEERSRINLLAMVIETWDQELVRSSRLNLVVFDLNQWYKERMQPNLNGQICVPFVQCTTLNQNMRRQARKRTILSVKIKKDTIQHFLAFSPTDEDNQPSSLSFDIIILTVDQVINLRVPGKQQGILEQISLEGPISLLNPNKYFTECKNSGLKTCFSDCSYIVSPSAIQQRDHVLTILLEHKYSSFLVECIKEWADGSKNLVGCSLPNLMEWLWHCAIRIKLTIDSICVPLFDYSGDDLDSENYHKLKHGSQLLHLVSDLYYFIVKNCKNYVPDARKLNSRTETLKLIIKYFDVVIWCLDSKLLPEKVTTAEESCIPTFLLSLLQYTQQRRDELKLVSEQDRCFLSRKPNLYIIDGLLTEEPDASVLTRQWQQEGCSEMDIGLDGNGLYPPTSLQSLVRMFLLPKLSSEIKDFVFIYFLLDVCDYHRDEDVKEKLMPYPVVFSLNNDFLPFVQTCWMIDRDKFDEVEDLLLSSKVLNQLKDKLWLHRIILRACVSQAHDKLALKYANRVPLTRSDFEDNCFHITLLLRNELVVEAYKFLKRCSFRQQDLFRHFFKVCNALMLLKEILKFPLTDEEEREFIAYLDEIEEDNLRVMYLLSRRRYTEAIDINYQLSSKTSIANTVEQYVGAVAGRRGEKTQITTRDMLVNAFSKTLPDITNDVISICRKEKDKIYRNMRGNKRVKPLAPLSELLPTDISQPIPSFKMSYDAFLRTVLVKTVSTVEAPAERHDCRLSSFAERTPFLRSTIFPPKAAKTSLRMQQKDTKVVEPAVKRLKIMEANDWDECEMVLDEGHEASSVLHTPLVKKRLSTLLQQSATGFSPSSILKGTELSSNRFKQPNRTVGFNLPESTNESGPLKRKLDQIMDSSTDESTTDLVQNNESDKSISINADEELVQNAISKSAINFMKSESKKSTSVNVDDDLNEKVERKSEVELIKRIESMSDSSKLSEAMTVADNLSIDSSLKTSVVMTTAEPPTASNNDLLMSVRSTANETFVTSSTLKWIEHGEGIPVVDKSVTYSEKGATDESEMNLKGALVDEVMFSGEHVPVDETETHSEYAVVDENEADTAFEETETHSEEAVIDETETRSEEYAAYDEIEIDSEDSEVIETTSTHSRGEAAIDEFEICRNQIDPSIESSENIPYMVAKDLILKTEEQPAHMMMPSEVTQDRVPRKRRILDSYMQDRADSVGREHKVTISDVRSLSRDDFSNPSAIASNSNSVAEEQNVDVMSIKASSEYEADTYEMESSEAQFVDSEEEDDEYEEGEEYEEEDEDRNEEDEAEEENVYEEEYEEEKNRDEEIEEEEEDVYGDEGTDYYEEDSNDNYSETDEPVAKTQVAGPVTTSSSPDDGGVINLDSDDEDDEDPLVETESKYGDSIDSCSQKSPDPLKNKEQDIYSDLYSESSEQAEEDRDSVNHVNINIFANVPSVASENSSVQRDSDVTDTLDSSDNDDSSAFKPRLFKKRKISSSDDDSDDNTEFVEQNKIPESMTSIENENLQPVRDSVKGHHQDSSLSQHQNIQKLKTEIVDPCPDNGSEIEEKTTKHDDPELTKPEVDSSRTHAALLESVSEFCKHNTSVSIDTLKSITTFISSSELVESDLSVTQGSKTLPESLKTSEHRYEDSDENSLLQHISVIKTTSDFISEGILTEDETQGTSKYQQVIEVSGEESVIKESPLKTSTDTALAETSFYVPILQSNTSAAVKLISNDAVSASISSFKTSSSVRSEVDKSISSETSTSIVIPFSSVPLFQANTLVKTSSTGSLSAESFTKIPVSIKIVDTSSKLEDVPLFQPSISDVNKSTNITDSTSATVIKTQVPSNTAEVFLTKATNSVMAPSASSFTEIPTLVNVMNTNSSFEDTSYHPATCDNKSADTPIDTSDTVIKSQVLSTCAASNVTFILNKSTSGTPSVSILESQSGDSGIVAETPTCLASIFEPQNTGIESRSNETITTQICRTPFDSRDVGVVESKSNVIANTSQTARTSFLNIPSFNFGTMDSTSNETAIDIQTAETPTWGTPKFESRDTSVVKSTLNETITASQTVETTMITNNQSCSAEAVNNVKTSAAAAPFSDTPLFHIPCASIESSASADNLSVKSSISDTPIIQSTTSKDNLFVKSSLSSLPENQSSTWEILKSAENKTTTDDSAAEKVEAVAACDFKSAETTLSENIPEIIKPDDSHHDKKLAAAECVDIQECVPSQSHETSTTDSEEQPLVFYFGENSIQPLNSISLVSQGFRSATPKDQPSSAPKEISCSMTPTKDKSNEQLSDVQEKEIIKTPLRRSKQTRRSSISSEPDRDAESNSKIEEKSSVPEDRASLDVSDLNQSGTPVKVQPMSPIRFSKRLAKRKSMEYLLDPIDEADDDASSVKSGHSLADSIHSKVSSGAGEVMSPQRFSERIAKRRSVIHLAHEMRTINEEDTETASVKSGPSSSRQPAGSRRSVRRKLSTSYSDLRKLSRGRFKLLEVIESDDESPRVRRGRYAHSEPGDIAEPSRPRRHSAATVESRTPVGCKIRKFYSSTPLNVNEPSTSAAAAASSTFEEYASNRRLTRSQKVLLNKIAPRESTTGPSRRRSHDTNEEASFVHKKFSRPRTRQMSLTESTDEDDDSTVTHVEPSSPSSSTTPTRPQRRVTRSSKSVASSPSGDESSRSRRTSSTSESFSHSIQLRSASKKVDKKDKKTEQSRKRKKK